MENSQHTSAFDALVSQVPLTDLEQEMNATEARLNESLTVYQKVLSDVQSLQAALERQSKLVQVLREIGVNGSSTSEEADAPAEDDDGAMTKREIAERILREADGPLYPREVRDIAVERGWLVNTPNASNQLSVAMNRAATKQDYLVKDDEGRYSLPRPGAAGVALFPEDSERGDRP